MLVRRATGHDAGAFGKLCDVHFDRVHGHWDSLTREREGKLEAIVKKDGMIKGIIGYKVLDYKSVEHILMQLKSCAMQYPGYVDAEFLVSEGDESVGLMISTWETMEDWRTWVASKATETLLRRARTAVMGAARLTAYRTMPTVEWR